MNKWNFFIARHWETESNITKAIVWITDVSLTEKWKNEAHVLGSWIKEKIDLIITSPQKRAIISSDILRKYTNAPVIEHAILHPQNFWAIEWMTINEARNNWLWEYLHKPDTDKYLHTWKNWESAKEMECRTIPEIKKLLDITKQNSLNILLMTHNSILRCLIWNINNLEPKVWIENHIKNWAFFKLKDSSIYEIKKDSNDSSIESLINNIITDKNIYFNFWIDTLNNFAKIALHEEIKVLNHLRYLFPNSNNIIINTLINLLKNTITLNNIFLEIKWFCDIKWVYSILHFWSSVYWKNYLIQDYTDLDIELIIDDSFDINEIKNNVLSWYKSWDIEDDFNDFILSNADYFSFKANYKWRLVDFRITKKECFDKICKNSLTEWNEYIMKEFRKQFRENGIVKKINWFDWTYQWENHIEYIKYGQIIHYPLFKYQNWKFTAWNNLDKYCSFSETWKNEILVKKQLFELRKNFNNVFNNQKSSGLINPNSKISDIFIRKSRFPKFLVDDLENRYKLYNLLFNK